MKMKYHFLNLTLLFILLGCKYSTSLLFIDSLFKNCTIENYKPEEIHIALGETKSEMVITWSTKCYPGRPTVLYGDAVSGLNYKAEGSSKILQHLWLFKGCTQYIHKVVLSGLTPGQSYWYSCGSDKGWSQNYTLCTVKNGSDWSPQIILFGDLGIQRDSVLSDLINEARKDICYVFIHNGDLAYNLDSICGMFGDYFLRQIQPIASVRPYMVTVGNHEYWGNFSDFKTRFNMPGTPDNLFYAYNLGPATIIAACSEVYFFGSYFGLNSVRRHYEWLENTLQKANLPENRANHPWIIVLIHRPLYCSGSEGNNCGTDSELLRTGAPSISKYGLEYLFCKYGVDLIISGHEHDYERFWPLFNRQACSRDAETAYTNPKCPVYFISGAAGNQAGQSKILTNPPLYSAVRNTEFSYTKMNIANKTHLYWEQIPMNRSGPIIDSVWLIKETHGPYSNLKCDSSK